jgi:hypothetical protein
MMEIGTAIDDQIEEKLMFIKSAPEAEAEGKLREIYGLQPAPRGLASMACLSGEYSQEPAIETL